MMGTFWTFLSYIVIVCVLFPDIAKCCKGASPKLGNMTADYDLEIGSTLSARCTLFSNVVNITGKEFYVTSENLMIKFGDRFFQNLEILDEYTVEFVKDNATIEDTGIYNCFLSIPQLETNPFVCTMFVAVGYKPLPVENFSCLSLNYESLNCSWTKPYNPVKTDYRLYDFLYGRRSFSRRCPRVSNNSCSYTLDSSPPYYKSAKKLYFVLIGNNTLGSNRQNVEVDHFKIVKPYQPQSMFFTNVTRNSLNLHWLPPKGMEYNDFPPGLDYWIHYCPLFGNCTELCNVLNVRNNSSVVITGLVPFMEYKFQIRCRSGSVDTDDMWSPFLNGSIRTEADLPYLAPETCSSSFQVQNTHTNRTITLYWKAIPSCLQNGDNFQYVIHYHTHYLRPRFKRDIQIIEVGNETSFSFSHMDSQTAYLFRIYAKNSFGISENSSVIIIDKTANLLLGPTDISVLSLGRGRYNLSWKEHANTNSSLISNYTLFWCESIRPRPFRCEKALSWATVVGTDYNLTLPDSSTNYQFAVASNSEYSTSGLKWASCIVPYSGVLYKVNEVSLIPMNSTSIKVKWVLDCNAQKSVIVEYMISFCPTYVDLSCSGDMNRTYFDNPQTENFDVTGLQPYTLYQFKVAARTADGWSEDSWVHYARTAYGAPSDPPRDVTIESVDGAIIKISFKPPLRPNGEISTYRAKYFATSSSELNPEIVLRMKGPTTEINHSIEINRDTVSLYTNYTIQIKACVQEACSNYSEPIYAFTEIGAPTSPDAPILNIVNSSFVNVTWKPPSPPNGPIDMYQLTVEWQGSVYVNGTELQREVFNISGSETFWTLLVDCLPELTDSYSYSFSVKAVNVKDHVPLYSFPSEPISTQMCYPIANSMPYEIIVGLIVGIAFGLTVLVFAIYSLAKWMKRKVDWVRHITVKLPGGLDSPNENPLNTYDKFKDGLQKKDGDSGIASERTYAPLTSYADKMTKDLVGNSFEASDEIFNTRKTREKNGRNQSGDSTVSGKCHDSLSSTATNKTHVSIDSGAEMDLPPSPDGMFSDTSSSNTTPRSYKPDLEIVEENNPLSSKDSGLEKEGNNHASPVKAIEPPLRFPYYIRKKGHPYFSGQSFKRNDHMQPYSKFAIVAPVFTPNYVSVGVSNVQLLQQQSLANSEPSVAEFQDDSDSEPLMIPGVPPYCRFGLARSAGNGLNITNQSLPVQENLGYSKFGIIYSALGRSSHENRQCLPNYSRVACTGVIPHLNNNAMFLGRPLVLGKTPLTAVEEKPTVNSSLSDSYDGILSLVEPLDSEKSIEIPPQLPVNQNTRNGYVSFNYALADGSSCDGKNTSICSSPEMPKLENRLPELHPSNIVHGKPSSYVSFQDAKVMSQLDHQQSTSSDESAGENLCEYAAASVNGLSQLQEQVANDINYPEPLLDFSSLLSAEEPLEKSSHENSNVEDPLIEDLKPNENQLLCLLSNGDEASDCESGDGVNESNVERPPSPQIVSNHAPVQIMSKSHPSSNGYVTWTELMGLKSVDVATLPNGTNRMNVEHV